ncbi:hypothetical protein ACH40D_41735 [Streptomyces olivaceoviridis]|uniref:Transposase n=1 Tax=Streptomyces olivaceoviridis TaxID=1921 RepID=A0ABW7VLA0_STROI|nr:hypothetical protein [Streptomyces corchorusii]
MAAQDIAVAGGIDTHADLHRAAVIDSIGRHLATKQFETIRTATTDTAGLAALTR